MIRKTAIAATAALVIAATMAATPAQALSKKGAFFLGLGAATVVGIAAANAHHGHYGHHGYSGYRVDAHVNWCLNRYRSYNPRTDTFRGYDGYDHRCISPYL